jgi:hypothetical protein
MPLDLGESWPAWHPDVRRADWTVDGIASPVLALLAPHVPGAVQAAREAAAPALALRGKHVLPLLAVEGTGREVAWIYPFEVVVALAQLPPDALGCKAAATVVRDVANTVARTPHPGPLPDQVLLDASGAVRIAHFAGPWTPGVAWQAPRQPAVPAADTVYRLGLLLGSLLGTEPEVVPNALAHEAFVRRMLDQARQAPGAEAEDALFDVLRDALAWDPRDRPTVPALIDALDAIVRRSGGLSLAATTAASFASWLVPHRGGSLHEELADFNSGAYDTVEVGRGQRTLDGEDVLDELDDDDDPTVDSELGVVAGSDRTPVSVVEFGSLPLRVGPPPEGVKPRPRLPDGFIGASASPSGPGDDTGPPSWLGWVSVILVLAALGLTTWLLLAP